MKHLSFFRSCLELSPARTTDMGRVSYNSWHVFAFSYSTMHVDMVKSWVHPWCFTRHKGSFWRHTSTFDLITRNWSKGSFQYPFVLLDVEGLIVLTLLRHSYSKLQICLHHHLDLGTVTLHSNHVFKKITRGKSSSLGYCPLKFSHICNGTSSYTSHASIL